MKQLLTVMFVCFIALDLQAQEDEYQTDSLEILQAVIVRGFENNRRLVEVPAAISIVGKSQLNRFNNISILPALNINPGIRMEERSPGSYRLNIRGSSLRSPFGVRNIKVYYNGIPYTDPGGNTFLNQLGFFNIQSAEIIKGPGSSLYGAGTGGVMLISSDGADWQPGVSIDYSMGSYKTVNRNLNLRFGTDVFRNSVNYQHLQSDGYRLHTEMDRKVFTWDAKAKISGKSYLNAHLLYGDLSYQTPGALTASEFRLNPRNARPRAGISPSSQEARAAITTKMLLAGFSIEHRFNEKWKNSTSAYAAFSELKNPTIRNYERRTEPHTGGRTLIEYSSSIKNVLIRFQAGTEIQQGFSTVRVAGNNNGNPDTLQNEDEINNRLFTVFAQGIAELGNGWTFTAGASMNQMKVGFTRLSVVPNLIVKRTYENEIAPRIAILKKFTPDFSIYGSISKGFSPPTTAELLPSTSVISTNLEAEEGFNYEVGSRGSFLNNRLFIDVNGFYFRLNNTIVQRRDISGADFFQNAGSTNQKGLETHFSYRFLKPGNRIFTKAEIWASHTWHVF